MRRLFWKFFAVILLAQLVTVTAIGALVWALEPPRPMLSPDQRFHPEPRDFPPPSEFGPPHSHPFPLLPFAVGLLASLAFALLLARHLSQPILGLRAAFAAVARGDFSVRLADGMAGRTDELADLGRDFDQTAQQLKRLMDAQRRLLHDVSHEVRSPLARIQLAMDIARQQPEKMPASLQRIERETARINHLMEELLTLSRLEVGAVGAMDEPVDLLELLNAIVADARFEAEAKSCTVVLTAQADAVVTGSAELLHRAIENVVRNAVRYTFGGTAVYVLLARAGDTCMVEVADDGPGLPEAALEAVFEPFVRFRDSGGEAGYGLGLAITRQVILAHGGSLKASNRASGGLSISLRLPCATAYHGASKDA